MNNDRKGGTTPDYGYWTRFPGWAVWEIAVMMQGHDPRAVGEIVINEHGEGLDTSTQERMLHDALHFGDLAAPAAEDGVHSRDVKIPAKSLLPWLHQNGYAMLATQLAGALPPVARGSTIKKDAFIKKHQASWNSVTNDFQHAIKNGLDAAAKANEHGYWHEEEALEWARKNGKLKDASRPSRSTALPS